MSYQKPILVIGSINLDMVVNADHIPVAGETLQGNSFQTHSGGKGANQAVAVARLGYPVQMIGKVGLDIFGVRLYADLKSAGVGLGGVQQVEGISGMASIVVSAQGENSIIVTPGVNSFVTPEYVDIHIDLIRNAALVLMQLEIPLETVEHVAEICFRENIPLILDPAPARKLPGSLMKRLSWFTPNETEAAFYINDEPIRESEHTSQTIARSLLARGPQNILLKMGSRGAYIANGKTEQQIGAIEVEAVDTTAAGDSFNGAFAVGLVLGKSPLESARFAAAAAALSVTRAGAQPSMPGFTEVTELLATAQ